MAGHPQGGKGVAAAPPRPLPAALFDPATGRPVSQALARWHIAERYRVRSLRCTDCAHERVCAGIPISFLGQMNGELITPTQIREEIAHG
mgnify:CR=1 FL=1